MLLITWAYSVLLVWIVQYWPWYKKMTCPKKRDFSYWSMAKENYFLLPQNRRASQCGRWSTGVPGISSWQLYLMFVECDEILTCCYVPTHDRVVIWSRHGMQVIQQKLGNLNRAVDHNRKSYSEQLGFLRWLTTVSNSFPHLHFDGSLVLPLFFRWS